MDETALVTKLRQVDAALRSAGPEERAKLLAEWRQRERDIEWRCSIPSTVSQRVFDAVCFRYGLHTYVRRRDSSTICVRAPRGFLQEVLWPEFEALTDVVERDVGDAIERVIERWAGISLASIHADDSSDHG
jgi:hypothetical protein